MGNGSIMVNESSTERSISVVEEKLASNLGRLNTLEDLFSSSLLSATKAHETIDRARDLLGSIALSLTEAEEALTE